MQPIPPSSPILPRDSERCSRSSHTLNLEDSSKCLVAVGVAGVSSRVRGGTSEITAEWQLTGQPST